MANENQFKLSTIYIATRGVKEYRESIAQWVNKNDIVLEIGCEWGTTTALLAAQCREVIGTDLADGPGGVLVRLLLAAGSI